MSRTLRMDDDAGAAHQRGLSANDKSECSNPQQNSNSTNEEYVLYFTRRSSGVVEETEGERASRQESHRNASQQQSPGSTNEEYMVCFTRRKNSASTEAADISASYEIVITADGDFAARRLDSGYIIAGYDNSEPELSIEAAAQRILSRTDVYKVYVRGDFSTVMCRIINEYYDRLRAKYGIWSKEISVKRFPVGKIQPDHASQSC